MAKNIPPRGDAKNATVRMAPPIVGRSALISSRGPLGPDGDGGSW